jgi:hypothetical protein
MCKQYFSEDPRWRLKSIYYYFSRRLRFFEKSFFHKTCNQITPNECKKKIEKISETLKVNKKKSYFDPPFWTDPPFLTNFNMTKYTLDSCC